MLIDGVHLIGCNRTSTAAVSSEPGSPDAVQQRGKTSTQIRGLLLLRMCLSFLHGHCPTNLDDL